jgi:two-component system sporulation sensor kinase A
MFTYDNEFRVLSISPNVERVFGYKPNEIIGRPFHKLGVLDQGELDKALGNAMNLLSGKVIPSSIYRLLTKDGITKYLEISGVPFTEKGRPVVVISVARDITERVEMEKSLHESAEKYRIHFSLTDDVMFSYDNQLRVRNVSPNVERVLGYKPGELIGKTLQEVGALHSDYMDEAIDNALHVLSGETINSSIYQFITKDGARKFGEVSGTPLMQDGHVVEVVSVARDITGRIEMQELLQKSEETSRTLLNASPDSMILLDTSGTMFALNNVTAERLGKGIKELLGTCLFDHMPKDVSDRRRSFFDQTVSSGKTTRFIDERDGRFYSITFYPIRNTYGKVVRIASYAHDVTRLKHDFLKQSAKD